jgi:hypothetical protein
MILDFETVKAPCDRHLVGIVGRCIVCGRTVGTFSKAVQNINRWASDDLRSGAILETWARLVSSSNWEHWIRFIDSNDATDMRARRAAPFHGISTPEDRRTARDMVFGHASRRD